MPGGDVLIGADIGGTKTHVRISADGEPARDLVVRSDSWLVGPFASDEKNAERLLRLLPAEALTRESVLVVGARGLDTPAQTGEVNRWLGSAFPGTALAVNDVALLAPAAGLGAAVCVVAGTGSKVVGRRPDGSAVEAGGHGFLIGDPGSAPALARDGIRVVLRAHDDGEAPDELARAMAAVHGHRDVLELWVAMFVDTPSMSAWGSLAPAVFAAAEAGSVLAAGVIDDHAGQLAADVRRVIRRGATGDALVCAGGVMTGQPLLVEAFRSHLDELDLRLSLHVLDVPPVVGAVALAREMRANRPRLSSRSRFTATSSALSDVGKEGPKPDRTREDV